MAGLSRAVDGFRRDVRHAVRVLRRAPAFTAVAVLTLGIGIGSSTAIFSVVDGVLLRPLPVPQQDRVVVVRKELPDNGALGAFPYPDLEAFRESSRAFEAVAGVQYDGAWPYPVLDGDRTLLVTGAIVSGNFFQALGLTPALGRLLLPDDGAADAGAVAVIGHGLWRRHFGGDPGAVGRTLRLGTQSLTVVGVAPPDFSFPRGASSGGGAELWIPVRAGPAVAASREFAAFSLIGRLRAGVSVEQAEAEANLFLRDREAVYLPREARGHQAVVVPIADAVVGELRAVILILFAAVLLVLLIAGVNVANLLLIRAAGRRQELALRTAVGAGRGRIVAQLLTENAVLAAAGGAAGVVFAVWLVDALVILAPAGLPRLDGVGVDGRALAFAVALSLAAPLLLGLAPALRAAGRDLGTPLRGGTRSGTEPAGLRRGKQALVVGQVALAFLVLACAGLLTRSLVRLQTVDMGFDPAGLTIVRVPLFDPEYRDPVRRARFFEQLSDRLSAAPGIAAATAVLVTPFSGAGGWNAFYVAEGQDADGAAANPGLNLEAVLPGYFAAVRLPIRRGRGFTDRDRADAPPVVIVSESLARRAWPGRDPIGKRLKFGGAESEDAWRTVVGVAADSRYRDLAAPMPAVYVPAEQSTAPQRFILVRAAPGTAVLRAVRTAAREIDPAAAVLDAASFDELSAGPLARPRFHAAVLGALAAIALLLAAVGLYGVLGAYVAQRTHELGVRAALGAGPGQLRRLVLFQGLGLAALGAGLGLAAAIAGTRMLRGVLFGVSPTDPATLTGLTVLLLAVAAAACYLPARRATRIDPLRVLRGD